ncbi:MAG TPA: NAD(P)H-binding protein [Acidimicrobiales bacterium]|nr:NAD(P)H-binding protein [Acidimicrobiales bacterium]
MLTSSSERRPPGGRGRGPSTVGNDDPPDGDDVFAVYLRAKARAEVELRAAALDHTIVRPGSLSDEKGTGKVRIERHVPRGEITRADVAEVLADVLHGPGTARRTFEVIGGETPVREAVAGVEVLIPPDG